MLNIRPIQSTPEAALAAAADHAPYLRRLAERGVGQDFNAALKAVITLPRGMAVADVMAELRKAKAAAHLSLATADLSGTLDVMDVTRHLTEFAGASLEVALQTALAARGLKSDGIFVIALGKMGAFELNYSSDIDVCAFYDRAQFDGGDRDPGDAAQRVVREMVRIMEELTAGGYVFRTDLRLRPDPGSTPVAVSTSMADVYYESQGQNWERMVWIKGRPAAGDIQAADRFQKRLEPFVWRRNLDYWAIGDIQAIKRMINTKVGDDTFAAVSPDVKLSPGGIREIEFFVQTQQLILGGREPSLRDNSTLGAMKALQAAGVVSSQTAAELTTAYKALRNVEHRIQMRQDEQTHTVPADPAERESVAYLCGYGNLADFDRDLLETRKLVQSAYDALFAQEDRAAETHDIGNLVFTGVDDDPGTVKTLSGLGFSNPSAAIDTIRNWHRGRVPATRTARGREILTAILPGMLKAMGATGEPDEAFRWFSRFFEGLSSGVQTLSMLLARPDLLDDLVSTLALAPRLAQILARRPDLLEALVSNVMPRAPELTPEVSFDAAMDGWRRYHREQSFLVGHRLLHGLLPTDQAAKAWTDLADETIRQMSSAAEAETTRRNGEVPGRWAVFAMGKLGGGELTAGSDLDIILIYDSQADDTQTWFTRLTQRLITALTAPTAEGALYEVDMRLRPSGRAGPVAVGLSAFRHYQNEEAWTWEHMALTRLRFVAGDDTLGREVLGIAADAICQRARSEKRKAIAGDVTGMRETLYREKPGKGLWDLKTAEGGLIDIEFMVQKEMLLRGRADLIRPATALALSGLADADESQASEEAEDWRFLRAALHLLSSMQQIQRLALGDGDPGEDVIPEGLKNRFCRAAAEEEGFEVLEERLREVKTRVHSMARKKLQLSATES
ncbi:bifunctional [glutamine synthetase] adenylyltransferase/[glutamine synthetase]-adenylyl-L-tyrosine phosphorylase [Hyphomonas sediminis]|uniref:bifunctional [glutamine synthetase] adenylyltransferase/[glutamine synthetase]-adenylyl-L-tyrosine phosphorylase n=1 Tax=Hyphomonas sediminis TaxID=2866160 RepID=UPI001CEDE319|nr:bifunctional [glutamine synthetase] adenylyltransferase/[glutamine synthetase]-adenylyl-L-tyrosine phosphorylase [Hyphomonas sediminis]